MQATSCTTTNHLLPTQPSHPQFTQCCAGNKYAPARWRIQGSTPRPAQRFVPSQQSRSIKLCVFVRIGHPTIVVDLRYSGFATADSPVMVGTGSGEYGWSGQRYADIVAYYLLGERVDRAARRLPGGLTLVHDRDPAHTSTAFKAYASSKGITVVTLPAKAPDLDPLDYGVFGNVKREWERQVWQQRLNWDQQCQLAIRLLQRFDASATIAALPYRMQHCIAAHGWHFEG